MARDDQESPSSAVLYTVVIIRAVPYQIYNKMFSSIIEYVCHITIFRPDYFSMGDPTV